jgi:hypothetical protein
MPVVDKRPLTWATFQSFLSHLPKLWDKNEVSRFHKIVTDLEEAYSIDLSTFRIEDVEMKPRLIGVSRIGYSGRSRRPEYTDEVYCDEQIARRKVDGVVFYFQNLQPALERAKVGF